MAQSFGSEPFFWCVCFPAQGFGSEPLFLSMEQEFNESAGAPDASASVADTFSQVFAQSSGEAADSVIPGAGASQQSELPESLSQTELQEQVEQQADALPGADELPEFSFEDPQVTLDKVYTQQELDELAQRDPNAAWSYVLQANQYLQENLNTIRDVQAVAQQVGSVEALQTLGEFGKALFEPTENSPGTIYQSLLKLQEAYPDPNQGPMNQVVQAIADYRGPEVLAAMKDQLFAFLDGSHPYFQMDSYQPRTEQDRYYAQQYISQLQQQRQQLLEQIAPAAYKHYGNDFQLREQYALVSPEGEYYGLADNTIDQGIRQALPETLRPVYDSLQPGVRAKLNYASAAELQFTLSEKKRADDFQMRLDQIEKQRADDQKKIFDQIEAQKKQAEDARVASWEENIRDVVKTRLTNHYKLNDYPVQIIQLQLERHLQTDAQARQTYEQAKEAARTGNQPLLVRLESDLARRTEGIIRQCLNQWQQATGQRVQRAATPTKPTTVTRRVVPLYSGAQPAANGRDHGDVGTVADEFAQAFSRLSPYVNQ